MNIFERIDAQARGKGMATQHPETLDREHLVSVRSDAQMLTPYGYLDALVSHENQVWVMKGIKLIRDNFKKLPLIIERNGQRVDQHDILTLLNDPNPEQSSEDIWDWWVTDMLLGGEEGWEVVYDAHTGNKMVELWPRQPHVFAVKPDPARKRYYGVDAYVIDDGQGPEYILSPREFMHFKFFNPRNPWRGIGPMLALRLSVQIDTFAQAWEKFLFVNNARPDYAVVTPQGTTRGEREDIERKLQQDHGGVSNAGKVIAIEEGLTDIKILSFRPKDLGELELRKFSRDEIAGGLGVPDILMGFGSDTYDTEEKRVAAMQVLYALTLMPLAEFRDGKLTKYLRRLGRLAPNELIKTDYSDVPELQEAQDAEWKRAQEMINTGNMTINDYNAEHGLKPKPWGDVWWAPANVVPITGAPPAAPVSDAQQQALLIETEIKRLSARGMALVAMLLAASSSEPAALDTSEETHDA
jgi:HK97 family phage portal protein